jgi:hypothetical protein
MRNLFLPNAVSILIVIVVFFSGCSKHKTEEPLVIIPTVNPIAHSVLFYLITPTDKSFNPQYYKGAKAAALSMQNWYFSQMGNRTFVLNPVVIDTLTGSHVSTWYNSDNGPAVRGNSNLYAYYNTLYELHQLLGAKFDSTNLIYFAYVAADFPDETIPRGLAAEGLSNIKNISGTNPNSAIGAGCHALGHAFGLPEVYVTNPQALMSTGFPLYPDCILQQPEKDSLNLSPFFVIR